MEKSVKMDDLDEPLLLLVLDDPEEFLSEKRSWYSNIFDIKSLI